MEVNVLESTSDPEKLACTAARNDYMEDWVGEESFGNIMSGIEPADYVTMPDSVWQNKPDATNDTIARMWTLLTHLTDHGHFGPFEHPSITFEVKGVSRSLMAQITRHRHASFDVQSMRYVNFEEAVPKPGEAVVCIPELEDPGICGRNAEFGGGYEGLDDDVILQRRQELYEEAMMDAFEKYKELLSLGAAPENARMVLPIGTKVNMVFTVNARMLMHIADMRAAADAQWEVRAMTDPSQIPDEWNLGGEVPEKGILDHAEDWMPLTFSYYKNEMMNRKNRLAP